MSEPITEAGPALARACNAAARNFDPGTYVVTVDQHGGVTVSIPAEGYHTLGHDVAVNVLGLLEAIRQGLIL